MLFFIDWCFQNVLNILIVLWKNYRFLLILIDNPHMFSVVKERSTAETFEVEERVAASLKQNHDLLCF